jgi:hypothetical protein
MPQPSSPPTVRERALALCLAVGAALLLSGCQEAARLIEIAPRLIAPGAGSHTVVRPPPSGPPPPPVALPPEQTSPAFAFQSAGTDDQGRRLYRVRIGPGGSPSLVAKSKLTPLFQLDGKDAAAYVSDAYFESHPDRTAFTIQPDDDFLLAVPPDTFVVRWQDERQEDFGHHARLREYVGERGEQLRYYLSDPFPIVYELQSAETAGRGVVHFHPDLAYLLKSQQTDPVRLAQLVYRVPDPDIFQVEAMRRLATDAQSGVVATLEIDRTHTYLDPIREALHYAVRTEPVAEPERSHLVRAVFAADAPVPFLAVEDVLGTRTSWAELEDGRVWRIEYQHNGTVHLLYKTGRDDALGRRDPYQFRENERWAALYRTLAPSADGPVKWGPGEPADLEPFPTARDPRQQDPQSFDYLVPGRMLLLTFRPIRFQADVRAQTEFRAVLRDAREHFRDQIELALQALDWLQQRSAPDNRGGAGPTASKSSPPR